MNLKFWQKDLTHAEAIQALRDIQHNDERVLPPRLRYAGDTARHKLKGRLDAEWRPVKQTA